jgi:hypothetical protein
LNAPGGDPRDETIGELVGRLIEDGRAYADAEIDLYKAIARYRALRARKSLVALAVGWFFMVTSMTAVVMGTVLSLSARIGPMWAGLAVGVPLLAGGYFLVRWGWAELKGLASDKGEREAIARGMQP